MDSLNGSINGRLNGLLIIREVDQGVSKDAPLCRTGNGVGLEIVMKNSKNEGEKSKNKESYIQKRQNLIKND